MSERRPIILSVHQAGTPQFPRWAVSDQFMRFYDGEGGWTENEGKAALFASSNDACIEVNRLLMLEYCQLPVKRYRAPLYLDLYCDHPIPRDQLVRWLVRVSKLIMDPQKHGNGPVEGSLGSCRIEFGELEEVKE